MSDSLILRVSGKVLTHQQPALREQMLINDVQKYEVRRDRKDRTIRALLDFRRLSVLSTQKAVQH